MFSVRKAEVDVFVLIYFLFARVLVSVPNCQYVLLSDRHLIASLKEKNDTKKYFFLDLLKAGP